MTRPNDRSSEIDRSVPGRRAVLGLATLSAPILASTELMADVAPSASFDETTVVNLARERASRPHRPRTDALPPDLAQLDYDAYRRIRFDPARALWADTDLGFRLQPHHLGFLFKEAVTIYEVAEGQAARLPYVRDAFDFDGLPLPPADAGLGFAGFRLLSPLNRADHFDEICSFLGASYFRALGSGQVYGISARGLPSERRIRKARSFPPSAASGSNAGAATARHRRPRAARSPSVAGAYRFRIESGRETVMDVEATLFPRVDLAQVGIAPGTSMFFFDPTSRRDVDDYRPEVHDSDGLLIRTGAGEQLWRPLANPEAPPGQRLSGQGAARLRPDAAQPRFRRLPGSRGRISAPPGPVGRAAG